MGVNSISEVVSPLCSPVDPVDWNPEDIDEATRRVRAKSLLAALDAMNSEVEEKIRRGETTWEEIEEFIGSLDRKAPQSR